MSSRHRWGADILFRAHIIVWGREKNYSPDISWIWDAASFLIVLLLAYGWRDSIAREGTLREQFVEFFQEKKICLELEPWRQVSLLWGKVECSLHPAQKLRWAETSSSFTDPLNRHRERIYADENPGRVHPAVGHPLLPPTEVHKFSDP
jgi:hypothetical protein